MVLSVTGRRMLNKCPHSWELKYITKMKGTKTNCRNFMAGAVIHTIIDDWFKAKRPDPVVFFDSDRVGRTHRAYRQSNYVKFLQSETEASHYEDTLEKAKKTALVLKELPFDEWGELRVEKGFKTDLLGNKYHTLYGYIDLWLPDKRTVYDFKISKDSKWFDREQVLFYCLAVSNHTGKTHFHGGIIAPLIANPLVEYEFMPEEYREFVRAIKSEFNDIYTWLASRKKGGEGFPAIKTDENCRFCEYKEAGCKAWTMRAMHAGLWGSSDGTNVK